MQVGAKKVQKCLYQLCRCDERRVCYHGNSKINFIDYKEKKYEKTKAQTVDGEHIEVKFEAPVLYADLGEVIRSEDVDSDLLGPEPTIPSGDADEVLELGAVTSGTKVDKNNQSCYYYMEVKYCRERERISEDIVKLLEEIDEIEDKISKENDRDEPRESILNSFDEQKKGKEEDKSALEETLNEHISNVCEANEAKAKYWCDGFKICLGHKTHYTCPGHKIVLCLGHTNINMTIKVLYRDELLDEAFKVFR